MSALKNAKHEAVLQAYVADREKIGWRAYKAVYPKSSQHAAETAFGRLLKKAEFKARLDELMGLTASDAVMTAREVLEELSRIGRANMADYMRVGPEGDPALNFGELTRDQAAALAEVTVEDFTDGRGDDARDVRRVKFKLWDKRAALNDLGRHHKLFGGELEVSGPVIVEIRRFGISDREKDKRPARRSAGK